MEISSWPEFDNDQINAVIKVLNSGKVSSWTGTETKTFEDEYSRWSSSKYSIALANGSLALSSAYLACGIKKDDEVITSPRTFLATASSIALLRAIPIFADVDIDSGNITAQTIEPLINKKTKAISIVHLGGWPADMISICDLARSYNLKVIEDCAQAHGASINGKMIGSFGDIGCWSFCQDKIISTGGEGGMITTSSSDLWELIWSFKDHGKSINTINEPNKTALFKYVHDRLGSNFRLTEMQSAIGRIQIQRLEEWNKKRNLNANLFINALSDNNLLRIPVPSEDFRHAWYRLYVYLNTEMLKDGWDRDRIIFEIKELGVPLFSGSCSEVYLEKCFRGSSYRLLKEGRLPVARELGETSLCFLLHPNLKKNEIEYQTHIVNNVLKKAIK